MKFITEDGFVVAMRDDGDHQNYLGLKLSEHVTDQAVVIEAHNIRNASDNLFDLDKLRLSVLSAVNEYRINTNRLIAVIAIRYVPGDPQIDAIYKEMALALMHREF